MPAEKPVIALDVAPLSERHHTGIANVTKNLARQLLADSDIEPRFFIGRAEVAPWLVERLIELESGHILWWLVPRMRLGPLRYGALDRSVVGIFSHYKRHRRLFPCEVLLVHDLTTLLTPQYHDAAGVLFGAQNLLADMLTSELLVAVSESTRQDIRTYFPQLDATPVLVAPLAPASAVASQEADQLVEPYILVLGTLEPRKNMQFLFEYLTEQPSVLETYKFVFVGRWGWGDSAAAMVASSGLEGAVERGAILFPGFVSDDVRDALLRHAACVVYASRYEGFGLPVLEALSFGTPVVTGYGSSLHEAGGSAAIYCDVTSVQSFADALHRALSQTERRDREARFAWAASFDWGRSYRAIKEASLALARTRTDGYR